MLWLVLSFSKTGAKIEFFSLEKEYSLDYSCSFYTNVPQVSE